MKQALFEIVRTAHVLAAPRDLPRRLAIYFHALEPADHGRFSEAIIELCERGYRPVAPAEFAASQSEERLLFISFDDNYRTWHSSLALFDALGITATFYVNSMPFRDVAGRDEIERYFDRLRHAGERATLSRAELVEIVAAGHTIGCHTHTHPVLSDLNRRQWAIEIAGSKHRIEDLIEREVSDFSYPFGMRRHFSPELRLYCEDVGFRSIATGIPGMQHAEPVDPMAIHRTGWKFNQSVQRNVENLSVDARLFAGITGRSAIG